MDEVNIEQLEMKPKPASDKSSETTTTYNQKRDTSYESSRSAPQVSSENPVCIEFQRVSANWINGQLPPTLCNITTTIKPGELCALVGAVGSGKSSMLHLLLKELDLGAGNVIFTQGLQRSDKKNLNKSYIMDNPNLRISYASQDAWLFGGTVRDNILFGQPYDKTRYMQVLVAV